MEQYDPTFLLVDDFDLDCPYCNGKGSVPDPWLGRLHDCDFCCGSGHVTRTMVEERSREIGRLEGKAQERYFYEHREFEEDRATWAPDRVIAQQGDV